jgi:hypothetical protein
MANLYSFCQGCSEADSCAANNKKQGTCDPCDNCFNMDSPACADCKDFDLYEALKNEDEV